MYEIGRVYVWQNQVGENKCFNGVECIVVDAPKTYYCDETRCLKVGQETDTIGTHGGPVAAERGDLRPKNPPPGEQKIRSMFELKPVMEVA